MKNQRPGKKTVVMPAGAGRRPPPGKRTIPAESWSGETTVYAIPGLAILPLRLFLGITFIYAGIQKLTDPGFFRAGAPTYIGAQLLAYSRGSPIAFLLHRMMELAFAVGVLTIVTETAIGLLVLLGLLTRLAAILGLLLNLIFFLSASWHTYPYFFGSDIVFVMCWLTLALTGPGGLALDSLLRQRLQGELRTRLGASRAAVALPLITGPLQPSAPADTLGRSTLLTRAEALIAGGAAIVLIALGLHGGGSQVATGSTGTSAPAAPSGATPTGGSAASGAPAGYAKIGTVSQIPANSALTFTDPKTGDPGVVVHTTGSSFFAYDAVCTHAGCMVQYDPGSGALVCPCHGGTFDPAHGGQVVAGPPPTPLSPIDMKIDAQGNVYVV